MIKDVMDDAEVRMGKAIDALRRDLATDSDRSRLSVLGGTTAGRLLR